MIPIVFQVTRSRIKLDITRYFPGNIFRIIYLIDMVLYITLIGNMVYETKKLRKFKLDFFSLPQYCTDIIQSIQ